MSFLVSIFVKLGFYYFELKFYLKPKHTHARTHSHIFLLFFLLCSFFYLTKCFRLATLISLSFYLCACWVSFFICLLLFLFVFVTVTQCLSLSLFLSFSICQTPISFFLSHTYLLLVLLLLLLLLFVSVFIRLTL